MAVSSVQTVERRVEKSAQAFRTISDVATELDVPQHVLRFWESKFTQVRPLKRGGGRRYYRPEDNIQPKCIVCFFTFIVGERQSLDHYDDH